MIIIFQSTHKIYNLRFYSSIYALYIIINNMGILSKYSKYNCDQGVNSLNEVDFLMGELRIIRKTLIRPWVKTSMLDLLAVIVCRFSFFDRVQSIRNIVQGQTREYNGIVRVVHTGFIQQAKQHIRENHHI
jgi:hypothetical protein